MSQIKTKFLEANSTDDSKVRLRNDNYLRARNAADSGDVSILKVNSSDVIEFNSFPQKSGTPSNANDLVNKSYVDGIASGIDVRASVRAATTANITLSAPQTIDGVSVIAGDRVLVKNQTLGENNGIYVVAAGAWSRSLDADSSSEVTAGMFTFVEEGTVNGDKGYVLSTDNPITLGTTSLSFTQFSSAASITAGAGLVGTSTFDVVSANTGIVVNADDIALTLRTGSGLLISSGLGVNLEASNPSLQISSNELGVKFDPAGALSKVAAGTKVNTDGTSVEISSNALRIASGAAGSGINYSAGVLSVNASKQTFTLNGTDITNQYLDLSQVAVTDSIHFLVKGAPSLLEGASHDYSVSYTGGSGGVTRITFLNDLATGGNAALIAGDIVQVAYLGA